MDNNTKSTSIFNLIINDQYEFRKNIFLSNYQLFQNINNITYDHILNYLQENYDIYRNLYLKHVFKLQDEFYNSIFNELEHFKFNSFMISYLSEGYQYILSNASFNEYIIDDLIQHYLSNFNLNKYIEHSIIRFYKNMIEKQHQIELIDIQKIVVFNSFILNLLLYILHRKYKFKINLDMIKNNTTVMKVLSFLIGKSHRLNSINASSAIKILKYIELYIYDPHLDFQSNEQLLTLCVILILINVLFMNAY